ncbi:MAG TPA: cysteine desulfurase family protein [Thermoanaerobaculia bacterium]
MIYLDNNATTRVADEVLAAMTPYYREVYGNAHAIHSLGRRAHDAVEESRDELARLLGCDRAEVIFTSCGTEGNAMVIRGLVDRHPDRRKVVTTAVEHPSVLLLLRALEREGVIELVVVPVDTEGVIDLDRMQAAIDDRTLLVSVMLAQNETGVLHPVERIAELAHARGAHVHVDAVQAAGKVPLDQRSLGADFVTISGHKFHAPKGIGALTIRKGLVLQPLWLGGGQELGMRSGTEAVPAIVGLAAAARLARKALADYEGVRALRDRLEQSILARIDETSVNGSTQPRLGNTANISFHDVAADEIVRALDAEGVCVSAGAACHSGTVEPSGTMKAMGKPLRIAMGAVRFSLSRYTTAEEIETTVDLVASRVLAIHTK